MGAAAAVLIVVAMAFVGNLPGPIQRFTHLGHVSTVSPPSVQGSASKDPKTPHAKPSVSRSASEPSWSPSATQSTSPSPSELCRSYWANFLHPQSGAEVSLGQKLATLAGGSGLRRVYLFCRQYMGPFWHYPSTDHESQANPGQNSQSQTGGARQASQGQQPGPGSSPAATQSGTGASPSTQSAPGSGQGNQDGGPTPSPPSPVSSPAP
jgi:hypothetical protein